MIGANLELLLNELELTPEEFGDAVGVGKSPIYKLLRGDVKKITKRMAQRINNAFPQYEVDYLLSFNFKKIERKNVADSELDNAFFEQTILNDQEKIHPQLLTLFEKAVLLREDELLDSNVISTWLANKILAAENKLLKEIKLNNKND